MCTSFKKKTRLPYWVLHCCKCNVYWMTNCLLILLLQKRYFFVCIYRQPMIVLVLVGFYPKLFMHVCKCCPCVLMLTYLRPCTCFARSNITPFLYCIWIFLPRNLYYELWVLHFTTARLTHIVTYNQRRRGAVDSASDSWSVDTCQSWVRAPSKASWARNLYSHCLVLVGSRNEFKCDLHKQKNKNARFTIELK